MTSQPPSFRFQVLFVFSRISLFSFKSTHLCYYATHTQQKLVFRWSVGKHALQTNRSSMVFSLRITNSLVRLQWAYPCYSAPVQRQIKPLMTPLVCSLPLIYKTRLAKEGAGQPTDIWVKVSIWGFETLTLFRTRKFLKYILCLGQTGAKSYTLLRTERTKTIPCPATHPRIGHIRKYPPGLGF